MKLDILSMQEFFKTIQKADNVVRDDDQNIVSFDYKKKYKNGSAKTIKVSVVKKRENSNIYIHLDEQEFFELLATNIKDVKGIKMSGEKIVKFTLNGKKYKTDKLKFPKLFDFLDFQCYYKVVRERFYTDDDLLRNGYFSGLIGTFDDGLKKYIQQQADYDLFDVDFNSAYPFCLKFPLPFGRFYDVEQWELVKDEFSTFTNFYEIKLKCVENSYNAFIPVPPFFEYRDFDFLLSREKSSMVVSAERLALIDKVYGADVYIIRKTYFCATKKYVKLSKFADKMFSALLEEKKNGDVEKIKAMKIALNSLVGNFGKRDESKSVKSLYLMNNSFANDVIGINWQTQKKTNLNYLPISMMINDITATRLFNLLTDEKCVRICYNTDGGIVAVKKNTTIINSKKIGMLKTKKIEKPLFFSSTLLYNRPFVYDFSADKVFNSNSIFYKLEDDNFYFSEQHNLNCRAGFITVDSVFPIAVEKYKGFNFRESEVLLKVQNSEKYKKLKTACPSDFDYEISKILATELERLCNPFDDLYALKIRKKPKINIEYEQISIDKSFFK